jgi:hypothetical protein
MHQIIQIKKNKQIIVPLKKDVTSYMCLLFEKHPSSLDRVIDAFLFYCIFLFSSQYIASYYFKLLFNSINWVLIIFLYHRSISI